MFLVIGKSFNSKILRLLYKYLLNQFQIKRVAKVYSNHCSYRILFTVKWDTNYISRKTFSESLSSYCKKRLSNCDFLLFVYVK